jgi:hypothetical protein
MTTALHSTTYIGPVATGIYNFAPSWNSDGNDGAGWRSATLAGDLDASAAEQLSELLANPARHIDVGSVGGVLEYVYSSAPRAQPFNGWYLLQTHQLSPRFVGSGARRISFSIKAVLLGDNRALRVTRSARARANDYGLTPTAVVADPFRDELAAGRPFAQSPGGTKLTREYDASAPHATARLTPAASADRSMTLYVAPFVSGADQLAKVAVPTVERRADQVPGWVTSRGGDVRAYDRRAEREVYGPSHFFQQPTDLLVTNGLLRFWVGNRLLPPFLNVSAFRNGTWREVGVLAFAPDNSSTVLLGARLVRVTAENTTVALLVQDQGEVFVTLERGRRWLAVQHGADQTPTVAAARLGQWRGLPPTYALIGTPAAGTGVFGNGLSAASSAPADVEFAWPPSQPNTAWTHPGRWRPAAASTAQALSGLAAIFDTSGTQVGGLRWDDTDKRLKLTLGATTIQSAPLTFAANDGIFYCLRFSTTEGLGFSYLLPGGTLQHVAGAGQLTPGTALDYARLAIGWQDGSTWGSGTWGSGVWGGWRLPQGVVDNLMLFSDRLTDTEVSALAAATSPGTAAEKRGWGPGPRPPPPSTGCRARRPGSSGTPRLTPRQWRRQPP